LKAHPSCTRVLTIWKRLTVLRGHCGQCQRLPSVAGTARGGSRPPGGTLLTQFPRFRLVRPSYSPRAMRRALQLLFALITSGYHVFYPVPFGHRAAGNNIVTGAVIHKSAKPRCVAGRRNLLLDSSIRGRASDCSNRPYGRGTGTTVQPCLWSTSHNPSGAVHFLFMYASSRYLRIAMSRSLDANNPAPVSCCRVVQQLRQKKRNVLLAQHAPRRCEG
jgi:hypothetical protein